MWEAKRQYKILDDPENMKYKPRIILINVPRLPILHVCLKIFQQIQCSTKLIKQQHIQRQQPKKAKIDNVKTRLQSMDSFKYNPQLLQ